MPKILLTQKERIKQQHLKPKKLHPDQVKMEQLELRLLVEQLRTFQRKFKFLRIKGRKKLEKVYEEFFDNCEKLLKYCEKVKEKQATCSEIYHTEMLNIYEAFERFKSNTNDYSALDTMLVLN